eukprot:TRINITY_DN66718_c1_g6_i1.p1 TRINITY_DN66718_c1_g6~~TRINITY_DN66718_c1_g6_i1.p1  ORF type:complete len:574 (-),score=39.57 TRINITY_DN66718_c1_g6_i1:213-1934(-)
MNNAKHFLKKLSIDAGKPGEDSRPGTPGSSVPGTPSAGGAFPPISPKVMFIEVRPKHDYEREEEEFDETRSEVSVASTVTSTKGVPPPTTTPPDLTAYIKKKQGSGPFRLFKKRWFELRAGWLFYYKAKHSEITPNTKPNGVLDLVGVTVEKASTPPHSYTISGAFLKNSYHLAHDTAEECEKWFTAIQRRVDGGFDAGRQESDTAELLFSSDACSNSEDAEERPIGLRDFELLMVIGKGSFAKVMKVRRKGTNDIYAMKVLKKSHIIKENMVENTRTERAILQFAVHPFIVGMSYAFQTKKELYLILDFLAGGELFYHLQREHHFPEERARFYTAEILLALEFLHSTNIIYRDLKPENLVLDKHGHVCLTDFGLSKLTLPTEKTFTFCGTPEYLAPEILDGTGHSCAVDWWSLGILLYEMVIGIPPFYSECVDTMYDFIMSKPLEFPAEPHMSESCKDLLRKLLTRSEGERLTEVSKIKSHPFFDGIDWVKLYNKQIKPSFVPNIAKDDTRYFSDEFKQEATSVSHLAEDGEDDDITFFDGFYFGGGRNGVNARQYDVSQLKRQQSPRKPEC